MKLNNKYYIIRHGEAVSNVENLVSCWPEKFKNHLTKLGIKEVKESIEKLKKELASQGRDIDLIFTSDLLRAKETADMVGKALKIKPKLDKRLREEGFGIFNGGPSKDLENFAGKVARIRKKIVHGETYTDIHKRLLSFFKEINRKYKGKNILIITHQMPAFLLNGYVKGFSLEYTLKEFPPEMYLRKGKFRELN